MYKTHFRLFYKGGIRELELCPCYHGFADVTVHFLCHLDLICSHVGDTPLGMSAKGCPERVSKEEEPP